MAGKDNGNLVGRARGGFQNKKRPGTKIWGVGEKKKDDMGVNITTGRGKKIGNH